MELRHLTYFLAVAEELNFARAAEDLRIAPSPLSRAIRELERELRAPLFDRGTRHVALTTAGAALVPRAQEILAQVAALRQVTSHSARTRAELTMGVRAVPDTLRRTLIDDVFRAVDADATVEIVARRTEEQYRALLRGEFDFGVTVGLPDDPRIDYLEVMTETYGIALPDVEPYIGLEVVRPKDISTLMMIRHDQEHVLGGFEPYYRSAVQNTWVTNDIVGEMHALVAAGRHCCFAVLNPEAPWTRLVSGDGVIIRKLTTQPHITTCLTWLARRGGDDDLGAYIARASERFTEPLRL
ncbi:LysR family transcriptional regulator [Mycolicibacterium goodii]|uniref:LysR family transcriptional regulator n=1 Tax=Mycolicibacterium goodii TaxID=134601 RepID=UPI001BDCCCB3|nr:LysR family transcriptional regulator [Mycolicibacterium goodii]MBU8820198.1 LysR family transcriptional regulator [Mycolicibacterium goodii]